MRSAILCLKIANTQHYHHIIRKSTLDIQHFLQIPSTHLRMFISDRWGKSTVRNSRWPCGLVECKLPLSCFHGYYTLSSRCSRDRNTAENDEHALERESQFTFCPCSLVYFQWHPSLHFIPDVYLAMMGRTSAVVLFTIRDTARNNSTWVKMEQQ